MGDQVYRLKDGENIPVEPSGNLTAGWMAGTWVKYSSNPLTFSRALVTVERSDGAGTLAGFLTSGPQHKSPVEMQSDQWTTDKRQRPGGDSRFDFLPIDSTTTMEFDDQGLLQRQGSRSATLWIPPTGIHKFYVFETRDKAERAVPGTGTIFIYTPNDLLYVSENGLLTKEKESPAHSFTGYAVAQAGSDEEGNYIIACAVMI